MRVVVFLSFLVIQLIAVAQESPEGQACLDCHSSSTPGIVEQWRESAHAKKNVDCYTCHRASEKDPATFEHYGQRIAVIVTPNYCGRCHGKVSFSLSDCNRCHSRPKPGKGYLIPRTRG